MSSLPPSGENYIRKISLIDRKSASVSYISTGALSGEENNLDEYFLKCEVTNTGNNITDNAKFTFRIPPDGTFIRVEPILVDENAKYNYLFDFIIQQGSYSSKPFRFEISQTIIQEDEKFGEVLIIVCRGREYILKENLTSRPLEYVTLYEAFQNRIFDFQGNTPGGNGASIGNTTIVLPGSKVSDNAVKQNWILPGPVPVHTAMVSVLDRAALPATSGGVLRDFYMDAEPNSASTRLFDLYVNEFGHLPILDADRVIVSPENSLTAAEQKDKMTVTDSDTFKNHVILKGGRTKGSLPMDYVRFASNFEHARRRPLWDGNQVYDEGSLTRREITATVTGEQTLQRYFKAKRDVPIVHPVAPPEVNSTAWEDDFTIYPEFQGNGHYRKGDIIYYKSGGNVTLYQCDIDLLHLGVFVNNIAPPPGNDHFHAFTNSQLDSNFEDFKSFSPWTNDADPWLANMTQGAPFDPDDPDAEGSYRGAFLDWNFVRANYDRVQFDDEFSHVTGKYITRTESDSDKIGDDEKYHGQRILVGTVGIKQFSGHSNQIAQYDTTIAGLNKWRFSINPVENDVVIDFEHSRVLRYTDDDGWVSGWNIADNNLDTSPIHPVSRVYYDRSADGTPNQAIRFRFNWRSKFVIVGHNNNYTSRGIWLNFWFPFPRRQINSSTNPLTPDKVTTIGSVYKGINGSFDSLNLELAANGMIGWNNGLHTEDLGKVSALAMKLKPNLISAKGPVDLGYANLPFTFFAFDLFDRVFFHDFSLRYIGQWSNVIIPFGENAAKNLYFNRINEVFVILGWAPIGNLTLSQKEFTGVVFDSRFVKGWGIQWKASYDDANRYVNRPDTRTGNVYLDAAQTFLNSAAELLAFDPLQFDIDYADIAIGDLRFIKEMYVSSDDERVTDARTELFNRDSEIDYQTAKFSAQARRERLQFFPQTIHITSFGDVRVRMGHRFLLQGDKVPGGGQEMVVQQVRHVIDGSAYKMEIEAKRKFVLP